jgi:DNA polymerase-1
VEASQTELSIYSARDCVIQHRLHAPSLKHLSEVANGLALADQMNNELGPIAEEMTWRGLRLDEERREAHRVDLVKRVGENTERFAKIVQASGFSDEVNVSSGPQLSEYFFRYLGATPSKRSPTTGAPSLDESVLSGLLKEDNDFIVASARALLQVRKWSTMLRTHVDGLIVHNGIVHPFWRPGGARTGRWSSSNPNLMNVPKTVREIVRDDSGVVLRNEHGIPLTQVTHGGLKDMYIPHSETGWIVEADYAQIEARIVALLAGDERDLELYARGLDTHSDLAWDLFYTGKPRPAIVTKEHVTYNQRQMAKTIRYALMYGAKPPTLFDRLVEEFPSITMQACGGIYKRFFQAHPEVKAWQEALLESAQKTGRVREPLSGKERIFWGSVNPSEALNYPVQTAAGYLINKAITRVSKRLQWPSEGILLQLHDALYVDGPNPFRLATVLREEMGLTLELGGRSMKAEVDVSVGKNCGALKDMKMADIKKLAA